MPVRKRENAARAQFMVLADVLRSGETAELIEIENNESSGGKRDRRRLTQRQVPRLPRRGPRFE